MKLFAEITLQMKAVLICLLVCSPAQAENNQVKKVDKLIESKNITVDQKYERYRLDGEALGTGSLYQELIRLDKINYSRINAAVLLQNGNDFLTSVLNTTDDDMRATSYAGVLQRRGEAGDPYASFFFATREWNYCLVLQRDAMDSSKKCWQGVLSAFKRAADDHIADAAFNIARMYENGFGVTSSKLAAADWYVKSATQYNKGRSRDEALTAVESALNLVPDHPVALRIRKAMLK